MGGGVRGVSINYSRLSVIFEEDLTPRVKQILSETHQGLLAYNFMDIPCQ